MILQPSNFEAVLKANKDFETQCYEQAKAELGLRPHSGIEWIVKVLHRAQEIKLEKGKNNGIK